MSTVSNEKMIDSGGLGESEINEQFSYSKLKVRLKKLSHVNKVRFAVFSAEQVLDIYEAKCKSSAPRLAIEAAKLFIKDPSIENQKKYKTAYHAAYAADAADAADAAAAAAAAAAAYAYAAAATYHTKDAAATATYRAAYHAAAAAYAEAATVKMCILNYLVKLEGGEHQALEGKPVYTQEMADNGRIVECGMVFATEAGEYVAEYTNRKSVVFCDENGFLISIDRGHIKPINTRTDEEKLIDYIVSRRKSESASDDEFKALIQNAMKVINITRKGESNES